MTALNAVISALCVLAVLVAPIVVLHMAMDILTLDAPEDLP